MQSSTSLTSFTIRAAGIDEASALTAIALQSKSYWPYSSQQIEAWRPALTITASAITEARVHVAESGGDVAGFYVLRPQAGEWVLDHFWMHPSHMGRGIGRALLQHAQRQAAGAGAKAITIDADPHAEAFYRACGAKTVGAVAAPIEGMPDRIRPQMLLAVSDS